MGLVPPRSHEPEWMDRPDNPERDLRGALRDIRRVNRWLGGRKALVGALAPLLRDWPADRGVELLDVGTGAGDLALAAEQAISRLGLTARITALDLDPITAGIAAESGVRVVCADAFAPPFPPRCFDFVAASMFLHHFPHDRVVELLSRFRGLARRAVLVNDLRRHVVPWQFVRLWGGVTGSSAMFRHDAPLSVLRGFTPAELDRAAADSGAAGYSVRRRWPYRLLATIPA